VTDQPTCGRGLAEHAALPALLAELIASTAEILELHRRALDAGDPLSRREDEAYAALAGEHRRIATALRDTAARMRGHRTLPMGRHDANALAGDGPRAAFGNFVRLERELDALLHDRLARDRAMLRDMERPFPSPPEAGR
jgi:hypothetical protein